jgi:Subtilase family
MRQARPPREKEAPPPPDRAALADYQRHLVVYGQLPEVPGGERAALRQFAIELQQALPEYDLASLDSFPVAGAGFWLFHLGNQQFTIGQAIDAGEQFAPDKTFVRNARVSLLQRAAVNDPEYPHQWALQKIEVEPAWQRFARAAANMVTVAIIDSGIQAAHEDFQGLALVGRNVISNRNSVPDNTGHGTMLAGTVAAVTNNAHGIAGIVYPAANLRLMVLKFDDARTPPLAYFAAKAVCYAAGFGRARRRADIINASWHVLDDTGVLRRALLFAQARGVLVVCAAGNNGGDNTCIPTIPASYAFDNMIAVAASDRHDNKARFSNYGATVDIAAPGRDIVSTAIYFAPPIPPYHTAYREYGGTSAAAAQVTAAAAMLLAIGAWTPQQIRDHLIASADPVRGLTGICRANGRLNLRRAICGPFTIEQPSGGQRLQRNSFYDVEWRSEYDSPVVGMVEITITANAAAARLTPVGGVPNNGHYRVQWPNQPMTGAVLRLRSVQKNLYAESAPFNII